MNTDVRRDTSLVLMQSLVLWGFFHTGEKLFQSFLCQASVEKCELKNY